MPVNSTSSIERFIIGAGQSRSFVNIESGSNGWDVDINGEIIQYVGGDLAPTLAAVVKLQTANDSTMGAIPAVAATLTTALTGANNDLKFTAVTAGVAGNSITIDYVDPGGASATLSCTVLVNAITVSLGRTLSAIDTTATALAAIIAGTPAAAALVTAANAAGNTGAGLVTALAATPLAGGTALVPATPAGTYTDVASATVNSEGYAFIAGVTGKYARITNAGPGAVSVVARPHRRVNAVVGLGGA